MKISPEETLSGPVISLTFTAEDSIGELKNERGFCVGLTPAEAAELRDELTRALDELARRRLKAREYLVIWVKGIPWRMPPVADAAAFIAWSRENSGGALTFTIEHDPDVPPPTA